MPFGYVKQPVKALITSPARAIGNEYRNTTGRPLFVIVAVHCTRVSQVNAYGYAVGKIGTSSPPVDAVSTGGLYEKDNEPDDTLSTLVFAVPNQYYYKVMGLKDALGSNVVIDDWTEVEL